MNNKSVSLIVFVITCVAVFGIIIHGEMTSNENRILITDLGSIKQTIFDEPFSYPENTPDITVKFVELLPGAETSWHTHTTPMIVTILHGKLSVYYCTDKVVVDFGECNDTLVKHYTINDTFVEAINIKHKGVNEGMMPVKIHAVTLD